MNNKETIEYLSEHYLAYTPFFQENREQINKHNKAMDRAIDCIEIVDRLEKLIPQNTPYCYTPIQYDKDKHCYHTKPCPYWDIATINDPQYGECKVEWCHYLGKELSIQDQVKDCGICED